MYITGEKAHNVHVLRRNNFKKVWGLRRLLKNGKKMANKYLHMQERV